MVCNQLDLEPYLNGGLVEMRVDKEFDNSHDRIGEVQ